MPLQIIAFVAHIRIHARQLLELNPSHFLNNFALTAWAVKRCLAVSCDESLSAKSVITSSNWDFCCRACSESSKVLGNGSASTCSSSQSAYCSANSSSSGSLSENGLPTSEESGKELAMGS